LSRSEETSETRWYFLAGDRRRHIIETKLTAADSRFPAHPLLDEVVEEAVRK